MKRTALFIGLSLVAVFAYAGLPLAFVNSADLNGFSAAINKAGQQRKVQVIFPAAIPKAELGTTYYVNADYIQTGYNGYDIYIDSMPSCNGAHYCNILDFNASSMGSLKTYKNRQGQVMTTTVILKNGIQANYTQGFALADYWNPNIAWKQNGILYTLTWRGFGDNDQTRKAMTWMANNLVSYPFPPQANS